MKRKIIITIIALFMLIISNAANMLLTFGKWYVFSTENEEFVKATIPSKGRDTKYLDRQFKRFKKEHHEYKDLVLYRTFKMEFWKFWKWYEYYKRDEYRYPYVGKKASNQISIQEAKDLLQKVLFEGGYLSENDSIKRFFINKVLDEYNVIYKDMSKSNYFYLSDFDPFKNQKNIVLIDIKDAMENNKIDRFIEFSFGRERDNELIINEVYHSNADFSTIAYVFMKQSGKWTFKRKKNLEIFTL